MLPALAPIFTRKRRAGDAGWPRVGWASRWWRPADRWRETRSSRVPSDRYPPAVPQRSFTSWGPAAGDGRAGLFCPGPLWPQSLPLPAAIRTLSPRWLHKHAFRRATPLDHITPTPLNIATARLAGVTRAISHRIGGGGWSGNARPTAEGAGSVVAPRFRRWPSPDLAGWIRWDWGLGPGGGEHALSTVSPAKAGVQSVRWRTFSLESGSPPSRGTRERSSRFQDAVFGPAG